MIQKIWKRALGVAVGVTVGYGILPRLLFPHLYGDSYPPIWLYALLIGGVSFLSSIFVLGMIEWIKTKWSIKEESLTDDKD